MLLLTGVPMNPKTSKDRMTLIMFRLSPFRHLCRTQPACRRISLAAILASSWSLVVVFSPTAPINEGYALPQVVPTWLPRPHDLLRSIVRHLDRAGPSSRPARPNPLQVVQQS